MGIEELPGTRPSRREQDAASANQIDLTVLWWRLWDAKYFILAISLLCFVGVVAYSYARTPVYTASVRILPQRSLGSKVTRPNLASFVAGAMNVGVGYEDLYTQILASDRLLDPACSQRWKYLDAPDSLTLYEIFGITANKPDPTAGQRQKLKDFLRESVIDFVSDRRTGYMTLTVSAPQDREFVATFANHLAEQLDQFLGDVLSSKSLQQQRFLESRLGEAELALSRTEDALTQFQQENRSISSSPELLAQHRALAREVEAESAIWVELRKQVEIELLNRNEGAVAIHILDPAIPPAFPDRPSRVLVGILGLVLGLGASATFIVLRHFVLTVRMAIRARAEMPAREPLAE